MRRTTAALAAASLAAAAGSLGGDLAATTSTRRVATIVPTEVTISRAYRSRTGRGRAAMSLPALISWSRQRRRARQTHPGKRGRR